MSYNPSDTARLGHRYQVILAHSGSFRSLVASRVQRFEPQTRQQTEVYYELGSVDPTGEASESPEFTITLEEYVHNAELDLLLAGKSAIATTWNLFDYIHDGKLTAYLLERNSNNVVQGELEFQNCVLSEISYRWQMGQPITASYTLNGRLARHYIPGQTPHTSWGSQDTTTPGGIRMKDSRLFLGGMTAGYRVYRLQGFTLRVQYPVTPIREVGSRPLVGYVVEPPRTTLDCDFLAADEQPDDVLYTNFGSPLQYYDYVIPLTLANSAIRIYDPDAAEAASVLRAWKLENLKPTNATPVLAQVRGVATKRYSFVLNKATTASTGGVLCYSGDIV